MSITKYCVTLRQAEAYQEELYNQYECVKLTQFPRFTEYGNYTWEVK